MNSKTKNKTKFLAVTMASFMAVSNLGLAINGLTKSKLVKETLEAYSADLSISNDDFTSPTISSSTNLPRTPSNWTQIEKPENVTAGIITLNTEIATSDKISNSYKLSKLPREYTGMDDKQILMINAGTNQATAGYKSSSLSLSSGSNYVIKFRAYSEVGSFGSARISGNSELEKSTNILTINTNGMWVEHKIYVKTNNLSSVTANLELWLGVTGQNQSAGAVFFDDISAASYDYTTFTSMLNNDIATKAEFKYVNLERENVSDFIENSSFESELGNSNWILAENNSLHAANQTINGRFNVENFSTDDTKINADIQNTNVYGNKYALVINNLESGYVGYKSSYFTVKSKKLYKLSFLVKTGTLENGATVKLVERNPYTNQKLSDGITDNPYYYNNSSYESQTFTINNISTSSYSNSYTNNWQEYSFYIKGSSLIDTEMNLELWLGTESASEKGYVLFDEFTMQEITSNEYTSNSSNGTIANLNQGTTETDFKNGAFNLFEIENVEDSYPYTPSNWTLTSSKSNGTKNGIINTAANNLALGLPTISAINPSYSNNNVLMIGNLSNNNQKYTSTNVSVTANSYAKITLKVLTTELNVAKAGIRVVDSDTVIGEILNIDTESEWKTYTIFVKTGFEEKSIKLELSLGENAEGTGYAFFDNVLYTSSLTADDYSNLEADKKIDLSKNDWSNIPQKSTSTQGVYTPYDWSASYSDSTDIGSVTAGVIDTTKYGTNEGYNESNFDAPEHPEGEGSKVLMIKSTSDTYYTYKSILKSSLENGSYYKISVNIKTDRLSQNDENIQYKDSKKSVAYPYGATINVDGIDATFAGINTNGEWKTYTMYINSTTESEIALELSLGNKNALTSGVVYFSSTSIEKITEDDYADGIKILESDSSIDNVLAIGNTDIKSEDEESDDSSSNNGEISFNWLLVPSIITGLAILVAVVGVIWRNYRKKAPKKPKIQKPYSKENFKKLAEQHKIELGQIKEQKSKLVAKQNSIAIDLNKAKEQNSENVQKLEKEYAEINKKLNQIEVKKQESNKKYKQKVSELKTMKKAERK